MDVTPYKFETRSGLPPDGERGQYLGFDADACAYVVWWDERGFWAAVGRDPTHPSVPLAMAADAVVERIVSYAELPIRWSEL